MDKTKIRCTGCGQMRSQLPYCRNCGAKLNITEPVPANIQDLHDKEPEAFHIVTLLKLLEYELEEDYYCSLCGKKLR